MNLKHLIATAAIGLLLTAPLMVTTSAAAEMDKRTAKQAERLAKKSDCMKCHSKSKKKDAPPYKEVAEKYRDKPDAEEKLYTHLTTNPMVEVDGKEEKHKNLDTDDEEEIRLVIRWILSL